MPPKRIKAKFKQNKRQRLPQTKDLGNPGLPLQCQENSVVSKFIFPEKEYGGTTTYSHIKYV